MQKSGLVRSQGHRFPLAAVGAKGGDALGIPVAYGSYEALLRGPCHRGGLQPAPNHLHVALTPRGHRAGKHVLCEKPIALSADEARRLQAVSRGRESDGGFHGPLPPAVAAGPRVGPRGADRDAARRPGLLPFFNTDRATSGTKAEIGGGGLYDLGCYPIVGSRFSRVRASGALMALVDSRPAFGHRPDDQRPGGLRRGRQLGFTVSTQCVPYQRVQICGHRGGIEIQIPFNAPPGGAMRIPARRRDLARRRLGRGRNAPVRATSTRSRARLSPAAVRGEIDLALRRGGTRGQHAVIDALFRSEKSGTLEEVRGRALYAGLGDRPPPWLLRA